MSSAMREPRGDCDGPASADMAGGEQVVVEGDNGQQACSGKPRTPQCGCRMQVLCPVPARSCVRVPSMGASLAIPSSAELRKLFAVFSRPGYAMALVIYAAEIRGLESFLTSGEMQTAMLYL